MGRKLVVLVPVVLGAIYFFVDPAASRFMPKCIFHAITGWDCPGCGSQRMFHALLHGNISEAWEYNAFLLVALPFILFLLGLELTHNKYPRLYMRVHSVPVVIAVCIVIVAWGIGRNLAGI